MSLTSPVGEKALSFKSDRHEK
jgi:hypothetical protein